MTGMTFREGAIVTFLTLNKIQNNKASEGAGIKLLPDAQLTVVGILWIHDNIAIIKVQVEESIKLLAYKYHLILYTLTSIAQ